MTIRQLAQILMSIHDLDKDVRISYRGDLSSEITYISLNGNNNLILGTSGFNEDKLKVKSEIEVKSPYSEKPQIF